MTDSVGFSVGTVARRLGVAPSTLRTWNRRYGIGARELSPGKHRRYTAEDITRLEHMQKLILRGAAPADAARAALAAPMALVPAQAESDSTGMAARTAGGEAGGRAAELVPGERRPDLGPADVNQTGPPMADSRPAGPDRDMAPGPAPGAARCVARGPRAGPGRAGPGRETDQRNHPGHAGP